MKESGRQLSRFAAVFAGGTMISRVSGLIRDVVWFATIPTSSIGPFLVAFRFPNMLRDLIGEGATNAAFVPVFSETIEKGSEEDFRELVASAMSAMLILLVALTVAGVLLLPFLLGHLDLLGFFTRSEAPTEESTQHLIHLSCWTFPYLFFIGMAVFAMGPLFTVRHYATPSWSPVLLNISLIASCLLLGHRLGEPAYALVVGVWLGGITQLAVQYWALGKYVGVWRPSFRLRHPGIRQMFWLLIPVIIGQSTGEVNKLVDTLFCSVIGPDKVKALFAANRLVQLPLSVFGIAVAAAILPSISRAGARGDTEEVRETLLHGIRKTFFLVFPAFLGLIILREPLVRFLFERRAFVATDTEQTAEALLFYTLGLLSFVWVKVLANGFYAIQNTKTPVIVASASMLLNVLLNCVLVGPMSYRGLALATSISFTVNFVLLYLLLCGRFGRLWSPSFLSAVGRTLLAGVLMGVVTYGTRVRFMHHFAGDALRYRALCALGPITIAVVFYIVICAFLDVPDLKEFAGILRRPRPKA
ncbi:MAG TPA: murein biosynthesis integral membrane protein MurJ [Candidatus Hydrogenedentes bacterium]|nr:murein biosynthesis integral membrane protein MurJ [Candidatus Hydrogenedentota bacterium]HPG69092.1 murein biosynthesis integral membrane protein MurJ [Candidatus Hydrogenedentota bacterium]